MAAFLSDRFPAAVRAMAARCKLSFALRPSLSQENDYRTKEKTRDKEGEVPSLSHFFYGCHDRGHGEKQRSLNPSAQLLRLGSPLLFSLSPLLEFPF
jgi:hypothetical protein